MTVTGSRDESKIAGVEMALTFVISLLLLSAVVAKPLPETPPRWSNAYTVSGVLRLPYAEIVEPMEVWFDGKNGRSRIDYYSGLDVTIQREDVGMFGSSYRVCPETTETKFNVKTCFQVNGTKDAPVKIQSVLPELSNFKFGGYGDCILGNCAIWTYTQTEQYKVNTYNMYTSQSEQPNPVHYEMLGYDTLLGSHYDKYVIDYMDYSPLMPPAKVFEIPGITCGGFPGPGAMTSLLANPMHEFVEPYGHEKVHELFEHFLIKHPKKYANTVQREEHNKRRDIFRQNLRFINSHNRKHLGFQVALNHLADHSPEELRLLRGRIHTEGYNNSLPFKPDLSTLKDVPDTMNWRLNVFAKPLSETPPQWSNAYTVSGVLRLPYAEIVEPMEAWFDGENGRSRIDYYSGLDVTIQREDVGMFGSSYRVCPETTETKFNVKTCFQVNGTKDAPVKIQSVLPELSNFKFGGYGDCILGNCTIWTYTQTEQYKVNTYNMYTSQSEPPNPVHYEMLGYDTLLGSHYDKYVIDYMDYSPLMPPAKVFEIPGITCRGFPGPGAMTSLLANPMQEFVEPYGHEKVHELFEHFLIKHPKTYNIRVQREEHNKRRDIFRQNLRFINSHNRKHVGFQVALNHLADRSPEELRLLRGRTHTEGYNGGLPFKPDLSTLKDVPDTMNWRLYGAVTPVKDQAVCGSCWSFGATGTIEGALFLKTKILVRLSQQNLIDCSWGYGNNGCDGGEEFRSYQWIMKHGGIATEYSYGQYLGQDGRCHTGTIGAKIASYVNVTSGDLEALKIAIAQKGPVSVGIDASHRSFAFYAFGVYYEPQCGNKPEDLDHAVLAVGYGTMNGQAYWLVKNSWSTHWGNDGYVLMSQKDNNCGVATDATFVNLE